MECQQQIENMGRTYETDNRKKYKKNRTLYEKKSYGHFSEVSVLRYKGLLSYTICD